MANLTPEQQHVLNALITIGHRRRKSPKEIKAAVETGLVESHLRNLPGGDADSAGWRQERASLYKNPTNLRASINRFYDETGKVAGQYGSAGALAAAVQRPAAQYRGRYGQVSGEAKALLHGRGGASFSTPQSPSFSAPAAPSFDQAGFQQATQRASILTGLITHGNPNSPLAKFNLLAPSMGDYMRHGGASVPDHQAAASLPADAPQSVATIFERAAKINKAHLPYEWGGGHGGRVNVNHPVPLDCSGAVSAVLGINPRVAGQFKSWGKPGAGRNVTIYAKDSHVIMEINGHFWGTSGLRGNGFTGAGWIPRNRIPAGYLAGFVKRHPSGL